MSRFDDWVQDRLDRFSELVVENLYTILVLSVALAIAAVLLFGNPS